MVLVVLLHASNEYYTTILQSPLDSEFYWWTSTIYKSFSLPCVPLFVILSGALLLQSSKLKEPIGFFLKKRFNRIGFAFIFWTVIYLAWGFFVSQTPVTLNNVVQGLIFSLFSGSYYHFWYIYLIVGLYLVTPVLRTVISANSQKILRYILVLWFLGVAVVPFVHMVTGLASQYYPHYLYQTVFVISGSIGYFILGTYLRKIRVRSLILFGLFFVSLGFTIFGTWLMRFNFYTIGQEYFFFEYLSISVIMTSVTMFMILSKFPASWPKKKHPIVGRIVHAISINTLAIYLFHVIVMETLQRGYLGFKLSITVMNPVIGIPVVAATTLFITFGLVLLLKRVPVLRTLIG
jgi:surface polysaccharide O-acyltransferase-like enzyme